MALPSREWAIAVGHDQSSPTRWNTIVDANSVALMDPGEPPPWTTVIDGEDIAREDLTIASIGFNSHFWIIPLMTVAQYSLLNSTYNNKLVTIKDILDGIAFDFYNATFKLEKKSELADRWDLFASSPFVSVGFEGWGWHDVRIDYIAVEDRP